MSFSFIQKFILKIERFEKVAEYIEISVKNVRTDKNVVIRTAVSQLDETVYIFVPIEKGKNSVVLSRNKST